MWCREYDKAWEHLAEANRLQHTVTSYDPQHDAMLFKVSCSSLSPLNNGFLSFPLAPAPASSFLLLNCQLTLLGHVLIMPMLRSHRAC